MGKKLYSKSEKKDWSTFLMYVDKLHDVLQDGYLRLVDLKSRDLSVLEQCDIGAPITSMAFSPSYQSIALGSSEVRIYMLYYIINIFYSPK